MFAFHRSDPRKTPAEALDAIGVHLGMLVGDERDDPGSSSWALRLYDLAHLCFQVRENLGGQRISEAQRISAHQYITQAQRCVLRVFPELGHPARLEASFDGLRAIVDCAASPDSANPGMAHVHAVWLQNVAHNAYLDWLCMTQARRGQGALTDAPSPLAVPGIVWVPYVNPCPVAPARRAQTQGQPL